MPSCYFGVGRLLIIYSDPVLMLSATWRESDRLVSQEYKLVRHVVESISCDG